MHDAFMIQSSNLYFCHYYPDTQSRDRSDSALRTFVVSMPTSFDVFANHAPGHSLSVIPRGLGAMQHLHMRELRQLSHTWVLANKIAVFGFAISAYHSDESQ